MKKLYMILPLALILCFMVGCQDKEAMAELEEYRAQAAVEEQNKALMLRWVEEINKRKSVDVIDEFISPDYVWHRAGRDVSFEGVKRAFESTFSKYPDFNLTAEDIIVAGDKVIVRWTIRSTNRETGEKFLDATISIDRVIGEKFVEGWELGEEKGWMDRK